MAELTEGSSSASSFGSFDFDVFLNFRGEDTRKSFTAFLYDALKRRGINVFIDNEELQTGEAIGPGLLRAIEGSKFSIPIFSKGYATSKWCLLELSKIVHCPRYKGQIILPIFFDVEPSHVRNQTGSFEGPFQEHEKNFEPDIVKSWREALRVVGNLKGWVLNDDVNGYQQKLVELVVQKVLQELTSSSCLAESKFLIGMDSHVNSLLSLLHSDSNDVHFVGICGFGGIGKTTIAKTIYNRIFLTFNGHSFLSDVRERASQCTGLASLQKKLLDDILKTSIQINDHHAGKKLIEQRLNKIKVLLVLDDVDSQEQIDALASELNWFGPGSRVIITTRDEHILDVAKVDKEKIYKPQELDHTKSLQLFSLHAFSRDLPPEDYMQLSHDVACYSRGVPLTLEVLGSYLRSINNKKVWESTLQELKEIPPKKVQERLKISYDNLENYHQKAIFLDAACFFIGWRKELIISIWDACGYHFESAIYRLVKRSLLNFDEHNRLKMHDQIRDMGKNIVLEENYLEPSKRSRLWSRDEIFEVLNKHKGTDMIRGIIIQPEVTGVIGDIHGTKAVIIGDKIISGKMIEGKRSPPPKFRRPDVDSKDFEMMSNLRFLDIDQANLRGGFSCLPSGLRWFQWGNMYGSDIYNDTSILSINCGHEGLVYLNLSGISGIKEAWSMRPQDKRFRKLKVLYLSGCPNLSKSPDFSWFPCLEQLTISFCKSLKKLDESIGQLSQLKSLTLEKLSKIKEYPNSIGDLKSLVKLELWDNALPNCVGLLKKLEILKVAYSSIKLPTSMRRMSCLRTINLCRTRISQFPDDFSSIQNLVELEIIDHCTNLPELPPSLAILRCCSCRSLVRLPDLSGLKNLKILSLRECISLEEIQGLEGPESLEELNAEACHNVTRTPRMIHGQGTLLPNLSRRSRYSLTANDGITVKGLILCLVLEFNSVQSNSGFYGPTGWGVNIYLDITACIHYDKDKTTRCVHTVRIEHVKITPPRHTIYIHHFKGFDWFGIPLQGKDAIEILAVKSKWTACIVKFWEVLFENREPDQQKPNQNSSAMMVADFFNWSLDEAEGSNSVPQELEKEKGMLVSNCEGACVDDEDDTGEELQRRKRKKPVMTQDRGGENITVDVATRVSKRERRKPTNLKDYVTE